MEWTYSRKIKAEITRPRLLSRNCLWAAAWGFAEPGRWHTLQEEWVATTAASTARWAYRVLKALDLQPTLRVERATRRIRYHLLVKGRPEQTVEYAITACPASFLHGIFLLHGYVSDPDRASFLELEGLSSEQAQAVLLAFHRLHWHPKSVPKRGAVAVYMQEKERIANFLALMGAHQAVLDWESRHIVKSMRNQVNRLVNSETANLRRTVESGTEQAQKCQALLRSGRKLPSIYYALALLRSAHPDWSLTELGLALTPPLSKSAVNHRMRKLIEWARK
ncbi:MAG: DNA-binding protein WhiA [Firmicutes bacterium]|nr:DNA-binding protein WhiA [Bacillota bacterium]